MTIAPHRWTSLCAFALGGLLLLNLAPEAAATQPTPDAKALHTKGLNAFKDGRFAEAGEAFMQAQALDPSASLLWNAARSFSKAKDLARAKENYTQYIAHADANPEKSARAALWLEQHPSEPQTASDDAQPTRAQAGADQTIIVHRNSHGNAGHDGVGWTLVSLGAAGLIGGTVAMLLAQASRDEAEAVLWGHGYEESLTRYRGLSVTMEQRELAGWLTYGAAIGLVSTGLILLLTTADDSPWVSTGFSSIQVNPSPSGLSASGTWRF
jgi:tetratricopeptide (TPR) repeat protein